ncbi:P-loop NTPase fold protein [Actinocrispum sp. NPDC049592]|uniref:KAP family P-loop NTPase fold protein n=1 Tax=Actinocrispum sp. NPDC049592 TaxID=3154835 RepID=UPI003423210A
MAGQDQPGELDRRKVLLLDGTGGSRELVLALRERLRAALGAENVSHGRVADDSQTVLVLIDRVDRPERLGRSTETLRSEGRTVLPVLVNGAPLPFTSEHAFTLSPDHLDEDAGTLISFLLHRSSWPGQAPSMRDEIVRYLSGSSGGPVFAQIVGAAKSGKSSLLNLVVNQLSGKTLHVIDDATERHRDEIQLYLARGQDVLIAARQPLRRLDGRVFPIGVLRDHLRAKYETFDENGKRLWRRASLLRDNERLDIRLAAMLLNSDTADAEAALDLLGPDAVTDRAFLEYGATHLPDEAPEDIDAVRDRLRRWRGGTPKTVVTRDFWTTEDLLGYRPYADAIANFLRHSDTKPPLTIGVKGPWGAGKTSLMRMVQEELDPLDATGERRKIRLHKGSRNTVSNAEVVKRAGETQEPEFDLSDDKRWRPTVWFNPWMYQSGEQIWAGLAHEIIDQVTRRLPPADRERFWLKLNLARLDRQVVRRRAYRMLAERLLPLLLVFGGVLILALGAFLLSSIIGVWVEAIRRVAGGVFAVGTGGVVVAGVAKTVGFWRESARGVFGPLVSGSTAVHGQLNEGAKGLYDEAVRDPGYQARTGFLHLVQSDMKRVLDLVAMPDRPLVVFVDDLDRCTPGPVSQVIEAINLFLAGEFPHCMFVLAMEPHVVAASVEVAYKDLTAQLGETSIGWRFLEKIVQLPISLPATQPGPEYVRRLLGVQNQAPAPETPQEPQPFTLPPTESTSYPVREFENPLMVRQAEAAILAQNPTLDTLTEIARAFDADMNINTIAAVDRIFAGLYSDADAHEAITRGVALLKTVNPREIKRFINLFRFYTFIAYRQRLSGAGPVTGDQIAKLAALAIRWPSLLSVFTTKVDGVSKLDLMHEDGEEDLKAFLAAGPDIRGLAGRIL